MTLLDRLDAAPDSELMRESACAIRRLRDELLDALQMAYGASCNWPASAHDALAPHRPSAD
jgi:hypothetical protein